MGRAGIEPAILAEADFKSASRTLAEMALFEQQTRLS
jgi:hypothetical protein